MAVTGSAGKADLYTGQRAVAEPARTDDELVLLEY
jgi:hypothetical protein